MVKSSFYPTFENNEDNYFNPENKFGSTIGVMIFIRLHWYSKKGKLRGDLEEYLFGLSKILNLDFLICEKVSLVIIDGAIEHNFPEKYIAKLRGIKHNGILDIPMLKNIEENRKEADEPDKSEPTFRKKYVLIGAIILVISLGAFWIKSWLSTHDMSFLCL